MHHPVFFVLAVAVVAPLLAEIRIGARVPGVVLEVLLGIIIGPHVLGWVESGGLLASLQNIGLVVLLFMAGMEIDFALIRGRPLWLGLGGWFASLMLGLAAVALLHITPGVHTPLMVTIALTTTGLGTLLPILRDGSQFESPFGRCVLAAATIGEVGPIVAVSLALSREYTSWQATGFLVLFLALVVLAAFIGATARHPKLLKMLSHMMTKSTQLPVRFAMLMVATFFAISEAFGFDGILGAFAAGMVVGLATRGKEGEGFRIRIEAICFNWLPFFFVGTGINFDLGALTREVSTMLLTPVFLLLLLGIRGAPVYFYRSYLARAEYLPFALSSSVASLGLVIVITKIGLEGKLMNPDIAQALIGAAVLSLLVFPTLTNALMSRAPDAAAHADLERKSG